MMQKTHHVPGTEDLKINKDMVTSVELFLSGKIGMVTISCYGI